MPRPIAGVSDAGGEEGKEDLSSYLPQIKLPNKKPKEQHKTSGKKAESKSSALRPAGTTKSLPPRASSEAHPRITKAPAEPRRCSPPALARAMRSAASISRAGSAIFGAAGTR